MKDDENFIGVYSHDQLPAITYKNTYAMIINYHNYDQPGSHWVCVCNDTFFDSFGVPPSSIIQEWIRKHNNGKEIPYNSHQLQNNMSTLCGYWCIIFIKLIGKGYTQYEATHEMFNLSDTLENEEVLKELITKYI